MKVWIGSLVRYKDIMTGEKNLCLVTGIDELMYDLTLVDCKTGKAFRIHHNNRLLEVICK